MNHALEAPRETILATPVTPTEWTVYETPQGLVRPGVALDVPRLREAVVRSDVACAGGGVTETSTLVSDGKRSSAGRHAFVRMDEYDVYIPLEGAPTWWVRRALREGFAVALVPAEDGQVPYLVTGEPEQAPEPEQLTTVPSGRYGTTRSRPGEKVGRNDPCPCGSGRKLKRCHGAVDA